MGGKVSRPRGRARQVIAQGRGKRHLQALSPAEAGGQQDISAGERGAENERSPLSQCLIRYLYLFSKSLARGAPRSRRLTVDRNEVCVFADDIERVRVQLRHHEKAPLEVCRPLRGQRRRNQTSRLSIGLGQIGADRSTFGQGDLAILQQRYFLPRGQSGA